MLSIHISECQPAAQPDLLKGRVELDYPARYSRGFLAVFVPGLDDDVIVDSFGDVESELETEVGEGCGARTIELGYRYGW